MMYILNQIRTDSVEKCSQYWAKSPKIVGFGPPIEEMTCLPTFLPSDFHIKWKISSRSTILYWFKVDPNWLSGEMLRISGKTTENRRCQPVYWENDMVTKFFTFTSSFENERTRRVLLFYVDLKVELNWFCGETLRIQEKINESKYKTKLSRAPPERGLMV